MSVMSVFFAAVFSNLMAYIPKTIMTTSTVSTGTATGTVSRTVATGTATTATAGTGMVIVGGNVFTRTS